MAIITKNNQTKMVIDLDGPQGNAFNLLGVAQRTGHRLGFAAAHLESIMADMTSSNYDHLISVFDSNFGDYIDLARS